MRRIEMYQQAALVLILGLAAPVMAQTEPKSTPQPAPPVSVGTKEEVLINKDDDRRDLTLLKRLSGNSFLHEAAKTSYTIPDLWYEIRPYRLKRDFEPRISTVLGIERKDRDMVASIYWIAIPLGAKFSDWVRATEVAGEYGEEYETLKVVYGTDKVSKPTKMTFGNFDVTKISVKGGPDSGDKYDGTLFLFEVAGTEGRYIVKVRVSYPKSDRPEVGEKWAEEVLGGFARVKENKVTKDAATTPSAPTEEKK